MAYDDILAGRVRRSLSRYKAVAEIKMFGGLCFTLRGNMCCGVINNDLMLRVSAESAAKYLAEPGARPMDFTGRPMKNFLYVGPKGYASAALLKKWMDRSVKHAMSLPPKI